MVDISRVEEQLEQTQKDPNRLPTSMEKPIRAIESSAFGAGKISLGPVLLDLPSMAAADLEAQATGKQDLRGSFEDLMSSTTADEINQKGVRMIGGTLITPSVLEKAKQDPQFKSKLFLDYSSTQKVQQQEEDKLPVPFSAPDYETIRMPVEVQSQPLWVQEKFKSSVKRSQNIAKLFQKDTPVPLAGQRIILDEFRTGNLGDELARSLKNIPGDIARLPTLAAMGTGAAAGLYEMLTNDNPDTGNAEDFSAAFTSVMSGYGSSDIVRGYEEVLEDSIVLRSADKRVQEWYKESFIKRFGEDAWSITHQRPKFEIKEDEQGNKSLEPVLDEDGNQVLEDVGLPPEISRSLVELAYNDLSGTEKALTIFGTQAPFTLGLTLRSISKGQKYIDKVTDARKNNPTAFADKTDFEVYKILAKQDSVTATKLFGPIWAAATLKGITRPFKRESMSRAGRVNEHLNTIDTYLTNINRLETDIDMAGPWSKLNTPQKVADAKKELQTLQNNFKTYKNTRGTGSINNPYTRKLIADDVIISTAVGYAPAIMDWDLLDLDEDTAKTLSTIVTPLVAPIVGPAAFRGTIKSGTFLLNKATDNTIKDVALTLENASYLPFITEGMLVRGDEGAMRRAMADAGEVVTDEQIRSFTTMTRIFAAMKPEARIRAYDSLRRYNEMMSRTQKRMEDLYLTDATGNPLTDQVQIDQAYQEIAANMQTLHLSLAKATGLAPLIAVQYVNGKAVKPSDLTKPGSLDATLKAMQAEEDNYKGMSVLLGNIRGSLAKKGVQLESNEPLQLMLTQLEGVVTNGEVNLNVKRQEIQKLLNDFYNRTDEIDEDTVDRIVKLELAILPEDVRETVDSAKMIAEVAQKLHEGARVQARALLGAAEVMDEKSLIQGVRPIADKLFDIEYSRRKALTSKAYREVNKYRPEGSTEPVRIDMTRAVRGMMDLSEEYKGQPLSMLFSGGRKFFNRHEGENLERTFETMAQRGLVNEFGDLEKVDAMVGVAFENGSINSRSYAEFAMYAIDNASEEAGDMFKYFDATVEEAEDVYRYFRDAGAANNPDKASQIAKSYTRVIDQVFEDTDPQLASLVRGARSEYQRIMGYQMDKGRYMSDVVNARQRKDVSEQIPGEGKHFYRNINGRPEAPFVRIAKAFQKMADTTDEVRIVELKDEIREQKNRIMFFLGAEKVNGQYAFDLRDPMQRRAADAAQSLTEALIGKRLIAQFRNETKALTEVRTLLAGQRPDEAREAVQAIQGSNGKYDFARAKRILEAEKELTIPVIENDGTEGVRILGMGDRVRGFAASTDDLLRRSEAARNSFKDIKQNVEEQGSILKIAAQQEVDEVARATKKMQRIQQLVENPEGFFERVFVQGTPESVETAIRQFEAGGMKREEIMTGLKYMYVKGLYGKAGTKYAHGSGLNPVVEEMKDITVLIDNVNDPAKFKMMEFILGKEHADEMKDMALWADIASGNGYGFRASPDTRGMSIDSMFARVFNLARGMVSPLYLLTEVSTRVLLAQNQTLVNLALNDRQAAKIINNILVRPESAEIPISDLELLAARIQNYLATELIRSGNEGLPSLEELLGEEVPDTLKEAVEAAEEEENVEMREINVTRGMVQEEQTDDEEE